MNTSIILIRHAESVKNLKDIHGGYGEALTSIGVQQSKEIANKLIDWGIKKDNAVIAFSDSVQTRQTAEIIISSIGMPILEINEFYPINMGVAHGISNAVLKQTYPSVFESLTKWRTKEIEISELLIPEMENPAIFFERGNRILEKLCVGKANILVTTTSLYILLTHILLGHSPRVGGNYRHININNGDIAFFQRIENGWIVDKEKTNVSDIIDLNN